MIITTSPVLFTETIVPRFFNRSTCDNCCKDIFQRSFTETTWEGQEVWRHEATESAYCESRYVNLRTNETKDAKAAPVYGPVNLELYWMSK